MRIDITSAPPATQLVFYGPSALHVSAEALRQGLGSTPRASSSPRQREDSSAAPAEQLSDKLEVPVGGSTVSSEQRGNAAASLQHQHGGPNKAVMRPAEQPAAIESGVASTAVSSAGLQDTHNQTNLHSFESSADQSRQQAAAGGAPGSERHALQGLPAESTSQPGGPEAFGAGSVAARGGLILVKQVIPSLTASGCTLAFGRTSRHAGQMPA